MKKEIAEKASEIISLIERTEMYNQRYKMNNPYIEVRDGAIVIAVIKKEDNNPHFQAIVDDIINSRHETLENLYKELEELKDE